MGSAEKALRELIESQEPDAKTDLHDELDQLRQQLQHVREAVEKLRYRVSQVEGTGTRGVAGAEGRFFRPEQVKNLRDRFDLTQQELAALLDVSPITIGAWETGKSRPRQSSIEKITELQEKTREEVDESLGRETLPEFLPAEVKRVRDALGLTQAELAELLDVSGAAVTSWETGHTRPNRENRKKLADLQQKPRAEVEEELEEAGISAAASRELSPDEVRRIREEAGLSQRELADRIGVSVNSVSNWETGRTSPRRSSVRKLLELPE